MNYTYQDLEGLSTSELNSIKDDHLRDLARIEQKRRNLILSILQLQTAIKEEE